MQRFSKGRDPNASKDIRVGFQVARGAGEEGAGTALIAAAVMVQADRDLNQGLQEFLLRANGLTPYILEHFMGLEEAFAIE